MRVRVNGEEREVPQGTTVAELVPPARGVAVAVDGEVLPRSDWAATAIREGQALEVLRAVQGG
ncbi:MAG TPA: sulfur carrier protein ThiS [Gaiellaceae bacterium]|jgi:sulfur carrier protein